MTAKTLYDKLWDDHVVRYDQDGTALLYIDRHLIHEVTSPQAFEGLRLAGRQPWRATANMATADHNVPTTKDQAGVDEESRIQIATLETNDHPSFARQPHQQFVEFILRHGVVRAAFSDADQLRVAARQVENAVRDQMIVDDDIGLPDQARGANGHEIQSAWAATDKVDGSGLRRVLNCGH